MAFDLGNLGHGIDRGFRYMAAISKLAVDGFHHGDQQKEQDALHVLSLWAQEIEGIPGNILGAAIGGDPFHGSRVAAQAALSKYGITV